MSQLNVRVTSRTSKEGTTTYQGTVSAPGLKATKLVKNDGSTEYSSASGVRSAAQRVAERFGLTASFEEKAPAKKAAKTTAKKKSSNTPSSTSSESSSGCSGSW